MEMWIEHREYDGEIKPVLVAIDGYEWVYGGYCQLKLIVLMVINGFMVVTDVY